jgi:hypothetical protein
VKTSRDDVVVDIDRDRLVTRMTQYFNSALSHEEIRRILPGAMKDGSRFDAVSVREQLCRRGFLPQNVVPFLYRPFDQRWIYWEPETELLEPVQRPYQHQVEFVAGSGGQQRLEAGTGGLGPGLAV